MARTLNLSTQRGGTQELLTEAERVVVVISVVDV